MKLFWVFLSLFLVCLPFGQAENEFTQSNCSMWIDFNQSPGFENTPTEGPFSWWFVPPADGNNSWCLNLTLNNLAGVTMAVYLSQTDATAMIWLDKENVTGPIVSGQSYFSALRPNSRQEGPYNTYIEVEPLNYAEGLNITIFLRIDNSDLDIVSSYPFSWTNPLISWAGQTYYYNMGNLSKNECQDFVYNYTLNFQQGLPFDVNVSTEALDTRSGQISNLQTIAAGQTSVTLNGTFEAPEGALAFRMLSVILPANSADTFPTPFTIELVPHSLNYTICKYPPNTGLSTGDIIGIVIGSVAGFVLLLVVVFFAYRHFQKKADYQEF